MTSPAVTSQQGQHVLGIRHDAVYAHNAYDFARSAEGGINLRNAGRNGADGARGRDPAHVWVSGYPASGRPLGWGSCPGFAPLWKAILWIKTPCSFF